MVDVVVELCSTAALVAVTAAFVLLIAVFVVSVLTCAYRGLR